MSRQARWDKSRDPRLRTSKSANRRLFSNVSRKAPQKFSVRNNRQKLSTKDSFPVVNPLSTKKISSNSRFDYDSFNGNIHHLNDDNMGIQKIMEKSKSTGSRFYPSVENAANDKGYANNQFIREHFNQQKSESAEVERPIYKYPGAIAVSDDEEEKEILTPSMSALPSIELSDALKSSPLITLRQSNEFFQSPLLAPPNDTFVPPPQLQDNPTSLANVNYFYGLLVAVEDATKVHHANRVYDKFYCDLKALKQANPTDEKVHANILKGLKHLISDFNSVFTLARNLESSKIKQDAEIIKMKKEIDQMKDEAEKKDKNSAEEKEKIVKEFHIFKIEAEAMQSEYKSQVQKEKEKNIDLKRKIKKYKTEIKAERDKVRVLENEKKEAESLVEEGNRAKKSFNQFMKKMNNCPIVSKKRPAPKPHNPSELDMVEIKLKKSKK